METIVFYDDSCSICNYWVIWILENDTSGVFYFVPLESNFTKEFSQYYNYECPKETIVVWNESAGFLKKSQAVLYILEVLKPTSFLLKMLRLFPKQLSDIGYSIFAYFRRYIKVGKCKPFLPEQKKRFLLDSSFQDFINKKKV